MYPWRAGIWKEAFQPIDDPTVHKMMAENYKVAFQRSYTDIPPWHLARFLIASVSGALPPFLAFTFLPN